MQITVYLSPYSSELNPIEMVWKVLKDRIRRSKLANAEILSSRVTEGSGAVPVEHIQDFIQHSIDVSPKWLNKEQL
jgi:transposase